MQLPNNKDARNVCVCVGGGSRGKCGWRWGVSKGLVATTMTQLGLLRHHSHNSPLPPVMHHVRVCSTSGPLPFLLCFCKERNAT